MLMPGIFGENLFDDDWMDFPFDRDFWGRKNPLYGKNANRVMKTDICEHSEEGCTGCRDKEDYHYRRMIIS